MNFNRTIKFIAFAEMLSPTRPIILRFRALYGRTNISSVPQRSIYLSPCNNGILSGKLITEDKGIFTRIWDKIKMFMWIRPKLYRTGHYLYESIADKIDYLKFFEEMSMPDTFNSWFLVTELHVWMLMAKAMEYGKEGRTIRNSIVQAMWSDVDCKAAKLGSEHASLARDQIKILVDQFQAAVITYDEGILTDDRVLASALWRRFFEKNCKSAQSLEIMVRYVRQQMHHIDYTTKDDFMSCKIVWLPFDKT